MIVTKRWLEEWIDLEGITTEHLCETLNAIGLEVDSVTSLRIPEKVVVGKVLACEKHPNADKLSVCRVDLGSETVQIVCGAKNVAAGQWVPVATIGAVLGEGFTIKKAKLRGVESHGMICSSTEIGLPKIEDGIMVLDESLGALECGMALADMELLNDDVIDIELTANRGDCLSIRGVSRDLSAALERPLKEVRREYREDRRGVARVLSLRVHEPFEAAVEYRFCETHELYDDALIRLRLAMIEALQKEPLQNLIQYAMHESGVLLRAYDYDALVGEGEPLTLVAKENDAHLEALFTEGGELLSLVGLMQSAYAQVHQKSERVVLEAAYIDPDLLASKKMQSQIEGDALYYRASRGSEPQLEVGMELLAALVATHGGSVYRRSQNHTIELASRALPISRSYIDTFIGMEVPLSQSLQILKRLGFGIRSEDEELFVTVPPFRHDIRNRQDLVEELVRMIGIDHITAKPLCSTERRVLNTTSERLALRRRYRQKAAAVGFHEAVHYFFDRRETLQKYGFDTLPEALDLANPITAELDTLRSTLLLHLMRSAGNNVKNGYRSVALFEIGRVVDAQRNEHERIAFIMSGEAQAPSLSNHGKPPAVDFLTFAQRIGRVVGKMELEPAKSTLKLVNPFEYATVMIEGEAAGFMARLHPQAERAFDLPRSYVCELDVSLLPFEKVLAHPYSKYPALTRDLSLMIPKHLSYAQIRAHLQAHRPPLLKSFYPIDRYEDPSFEERYNLTMRFVLQSPQKTLEEEEIDGTMEEILARLGEIGVVLR